MTNLMTIDTNQAMSTGFQNAELDAHVRTMIASLRMHNNSNWRYAEAVASIVVNKEYVEDFKELDAFCEALGVSKGRTSQYKKAVEFINGDIAKKYSFDWRECNDMNAYLLATITRKAKDEKGKNVTVSDTDAFIEWFLKENDGLVPWTLTQKALKDAIAAYKKDRDAITVDGDAVEDKASAAEMNEPETEEKVEAKSLADMSDEELTITYLAVKAEMVKRGLEI